MLFQKKPKNLTIPKHLAIILDGNGRWAKRRGMPRTFGHQVGIENIRSIAIECSKLGIKALSVYAFSTENWARPQAEVDYLMTMPAQFEKQFKDDFEKYDIRVVFSGRKTKMSAENKEILERITSNTANRSGLILNICFDYGSYYEITEAVKSISEAAMNHEIEVSDITPEVISSYLFTANLPPLDLFIRTSGEIRLSNYLLWQAAYSELYFTKVPWPAFDKKQLLLALEEFTNRDRRYGGLKG
ncbi:MAG: polyprenyl diphosphate synthase [bacterium]|jgi:undecaprenyl diphosphate synthase|nr:polyprenyl diphosphate synthase [bacterium]